MDIEKILAGGFSNSGWEGLDDQTNGVDESKQAAEHDAFLKANEIAAAFKTPQGRIALQRLRETTYLNATWLVDTMGLINAVGYGIFREGQNSLVRYIDACIVKAEAGPPIAKQTKKRGK